MSHWISRMALQIIVPWVILNEIIAVTYWVSFVTHCVSPHWICPMAIRWKMGHFPQKSPVQLGIILLSLIRDSLRIASLNMPHGHTDHRAMTDTQRKHTQLSTTGWRKCLSQKSVLYSFSMVNLGASWLLRIVAKMPQMPWLRGSQGSFVENGSFSTKEPCTVGYHLIESHLWLIAYPLIEYTSWPYGGKWVIFHKRALYSWVRIIVPWVILHGRILNESRQGRKRAI